MKGFSLGATLPRLALSLAAVVFAVGCPDKAAEKNDDDKGGEGEAGEGEGETGEAGEGEGEGEGGVIPDGCVGNAAAEATFAVYRGMAPSCIGCHGNGTSKPYFASFEGFTNGLVADPTWIIPGDAAASALLPLLRGTGTGTFAQMPLVGEPYANLPGITVDVDAIASWLNALPANGIACSNVDRAEVHRLPAEGFVAALATALDYSADELREPGFTPEFTNTDNPDNLAFIDGYNTRKADRFRSLGGPHWTQGKARNNDVTRSFQLEVVQMALGHCRRAIANDNKTALFRFGNRDTGMNDAAAVRDNLRYWHLRFLSVTPTDDELDELVAVFADSEAAAGAREAWISTCAALVRDPLFLLY